MRLPPVSPARHQFVMAPPASVLVGALCVHIRNSSSLRESSKV
jgi:hypothetical protein